MIRTDYPFVQNREQWLRFLAVAVFFLYFVFTFFGTELPFQEKYQDVQDVDTSNILNQVIYSPMYVAAVLCLLYKYQSAWNVIRSEKYLTLFLAWSLISILWSDYWFVSFKRWLQLFGGTAVILSGLVYARTTENILASIRIVLVCYLTLTLAAIIFHPGALDPDFHTFRGLEPSKNVFGQTCLLSLIFWTYFLQNSHSRLESGANIFFWILSFFLFVGSASYTAYFSLGFLLIIFFNIYLHKKIFKRVIGSIFSYLLLLFTNASIFWLLLALKGPIERVLHLFGKDLTLTGRTELWTLVFELTKDHLFLGSGFGGFWTPNASFMHSFFEEHYWIPNQSHMGYLDVWNNTGLIGLLLCIWMLVSCLRKLAYYEKTTLWKWCILAALVLNVAESLLFNSHMLVNEILVLSYLAFYTEQNEQILCPHERREKRSSLYRTNHPIGGRPESSS